MTEPSIPTDEEDPTLRERVSMLEQINHALEQRMHLLEQELTGLREVVEGLSMEAAGWRKTYSAVAQDRDLSRKQLHLEGIAP